MSRPPLGWTLALSAYWFSTSFKWFIVLLGGLLAARVQNLVPGGEESAAWGMVVAFGAAEACVGPALMGFASDRLRSRGVSRHYFLIAGALLTVVSLLVLGSAQSYGAIVFGYFLLQVSDDVGTAPYAALIPELVAKEHRGYASGVMGFLQQFAQIVAAVVGLLLKADPMHIWIAIAIVNVLGAATVVAFVREREFTRLAPTGIDLKELSQAWLGPWKNPDFRWVWFTRFLNAVGLYPIMAFALFYFQQNLGMTEDKAKESQLMLALLISLVAATAALFAGRLADRWGRKKVVLASGWVMFVGLLPLVFIADFKAVIVAAIPFAIGYGAYVSADWALAADIMPSQEDFARDMGMWSMSIPLGQVLAGLSGSLVKPLQQATGNHGYQALWFLCAVVFLFSATLVKRVRGST